MKDEIYKELNKIGDDIISMSPEEYKARIEKHSSGDIAQWLKQINFNIVKGFRIIFLDIDGVLNSMNGLYKRGGQSRIDLYSEHIDILQWILNQTDARIVISSTWRKNRSVDDLKQLLYNYGLPSKYIIDKTPVLDSKNNAEVINGKTYYKVERGDEIQKWLDDCPYLIDKFVLLDDDSDMGKLKDNLVQTNHDYGLTYVEGIETVSRLIDISVNELLQDY